MQECPVYSQSEQDALAPTGVLRASINLGNAVLAGRDPLGAPEGVTVDMARELEPTGNSSRVEKFHDG